MMLLVGSKSIHPGTWQVDLYPCVRPASAAREPVLPGSKDVPADKTRRETEGTNGFHHQDGVVAAAPRTALERFVRALHAFFAAPRVDKPDCEFHA